MNLENTTSSTLPENDDVHNYPSTLPVVNHRKKQNLIHERQGLELLLSLLFSNSLKSPDIPDNHHHTRGLGHRFSLFKRDSFVVQVDSHRYDKHAFKDKEIEQYTESLLVKKLEHLFNEPHHLIDEAEAVEEQMMNLVYKHFSDIVQGHESSQTSRLKLEHVISSLTDLESHTEILFANCQKIPLDYLSNTRLKNNKLEKHLHSVTILLSSCLMLDQLVEKGNYDEAIDLIAHLQKINSRYPEIVVLSKIVGYLNHVLSTMKRQLLTILRTQDRLPILLRTVGYLRRLGVFTETDLRLLFLQERSSLLLSKLKEMNELLFEEEQLAAELKQRIDLSREQLFDIVTQYRAAFGESDLITSHKMNHNTSLGKYNSASSPTSTVALSSENSIQSSLNHILPWFIQSWFTELLITLNQIDYPDMSCLHTVYTQLMYFGLSAGRLGLDFRHFLNDFVKQGVLKLSSTLLKEAHDNIMVFTEHHGLLKKQSSAAANAAISLSSPSSPESPDEMFTSFGNTTLISPPSHGSEYLVLCATINAYFSVFNQWRVLPLISVVETQLQLLNDSLLELAELFHSFSPSASPKDQQADSNMNHSNKIAFDSFIYFFTEVVVPHILRAFQQGLYKDYFNKRNDSLKRLQDTTHKIVQIFKNEGHDDEQNEISNATVKKDNEKIQAENSQSLK